MKRKPGFFRRCGDWLLLGSLATGGCQTCSCNPVPVPPEVVSVCHQLPRACRTHVYVFFIKGLDPIKGHELKKLHAQVQQAGFGQSYAGNLLHLPELYLEACKIAEADKEARIVLVGTGPGISGLTHVANMLAKKNVPVCKVCYFAEQAEDAEEDGIDYLGGVDESAALARLIDELVDLAGQVPVKLPPPPRLDPDEPTPRPVAPRSIGRSDKWDFLKPSDTVNMVNSSSVP